MRRSQRNRRLLDEDVLLPITRSRSYRDDPRDRRSYDEDDRGGSLIHEYILRPLGRWALGYVWKGLLAVVFLKFFLGVDFSTIWNVGSLIWRFTASGNDAMHSLMSQFSGILQ